MKTHKIYLIAAFVLALANGSLAADDSKYIEAMQKNIQVVYTSASIPDLQAAVNTFERIASAEKTKWEPYYYASFGHIMMSANEQDKAKKDAYLDLAMVACNKAKEIVPNESEVVALEGFIQMMKLNVDPAARGQQYSQLAYKSYGKATALNPENPRALALLAQMQFGTAKFFNSPTTEACATNSKALEKFTTFKSDNPLAPQWGKRMAEGMSEQCK